MMRNVSRTVLRQCSRRGIATTTIKTNSFRPYLMLGSLGFLGGLTVYDNMQKSNTRCDSSGMFGNSHNQASFIADAVEKAIPALVNITVTQRMGGGYLMAQSSGSGFIIDPNGLIATNAHVVKSASSITITLYDGTVLKGNVVATDPVADLALVRVSEPLIAPLPTMEIGDSSTLRPGEFVVALGSPLNMQNSVTAGIVSSTVRAASEIGMPQARTDYIQTDAAINQGNSGGPLINLDGKVVGINTMKVAGAGGIGFAIPINTAWIVLTQLRETGTVVRPFIGLRMVQITSEVLKYERKLRRQSIPSDTGVLVWDIAPGSPAERAGIRKGDVIVNIDDVKIKSTHEITTKLGYNVGTTHKFTILRSNESPSEVYVTSEPAK